MQRTSKQEPYAELSVDLKCPTSRREVAKEMEQFVAGIPSSLGIDWVKDPDYLEHFEADRMCIMRQALMDAGIAREQDIAVLDVGYLHGLLPEFLHRFFPRSRFTVIDRPDSPNFKSPLYRDAVARRGYLELVPCRLEDVGQLERRFDVIVLGEVIEHLDPTVAARAFAELKRLANPGGCLIITTPNAASIKDTVLTLLGHDSQNAPIPDETMGYPHIHLWSDPLLRQTLAHFGWEPIRAYYYRGKDAIEFAHSNRHWCSWKAQVLQKFFFLGSMLRNSWRGYMVSTWRSTHTGVVSR